MKTYFKTRVLWMVFGTFCFATVPAFAATLTGKVSFEGEAPAPKAINFGAEKQCALMHGDNIPKDESLAVNSNKTIRWALVYVADVPGEYAAPEKPAEMDQKGCTFVPHVLAVMKGQKVNYKNGDPVLHNVRANAKTNKMFNIAQPVQGMVTAKTFTEPEIGIQMRCDVHFWMASYVHVMANPFFAVTGDEGTFTIQDIPAGTHELTLWHETLGTQTQSVTVGEGETKTVDFTLKKG